MRFNSPARFIPFLAIAAFVFSVVVFLSPAQASTDGARAYVEKISSDVLEIIRSKASDKEKITKLEGIFHDAVDSKFMGRFALGQHYRKLSADKQKKYLELYDAYLIQSYVPRFKDYTDQALKITNVKSQAENEYLVQTEIVSKSGKPAVVVDYRLRKNGAGYKVIDIIGEGISLITTQRSDFGGIISQQSLDSFIEKLEAKVAANKKS